MQTGSSRGSYEFAHPSGRHRPSGGLPGVLNELLPMAWHRTEQYANNRVQADHGRLKARLRPMRGLKQDRSVRVVIAGHALCRTSAGSTLSWRSRSR
jgi:transposase-like protein